MRRKVCFWVILAVTCLSATAALAAPVMPKINIGVDASSNPKDISASLQILFLLTILSMAPAIFMMVTSFTRIIIVLSFTRSALGAQQIPPNSVLIGLAIFLTFFTMSPVFKQINEKAFQPYMKQQISFETAIDRADDPIRDFMFSQVREKDIALFIDLAGINRPQTEADVPTTVLIPAFLISELRTAFSIGFLIFIPFLIIDVVVSVTLMSMGMMMLPPMLISLPFKILLFVLVDGWHLIIQSLALSFK